MLDDQERNNNLLKHIPQEELSTNYSFLIALCKKCLSVDPKDRPKDGETLYDLLVEGASKTSAASSMLVMGLNNQNNAALATAHPSNNSNSSSGDPSSSSSSQQQQQQQQHDSQHSTGTSQEGQQQHSTDDLVTCSSKTEIIDFGGVTY